MANGQLSFDLGPPARPDVFFFALRPTADAARAAMEVAKRYRRWHGLSGRPYGPDRLHVSLNPVESPRGFRKDDVEAAARAAARVDGAPFTVSFDRICRFGRRGAGPIVLRCGAGTAELAALREALRREMVKVGLWHGPAHFDPHLTLLWDGRPIPESHLDAPIGWTVEDFVLVRSVIGRSRHVDLGRWPLGPGPGNGTDISRNGMSGAAGSSPRGSAASPGTPEAIAPQPLPRGLRARTSARRPAAPDPPAPA